MPITKLFAGIQRRPGGSASVELMLVTAVSTIIATRVYLQATGFPQMGRGGIHIAHLSWGGLLMLGGLIVLMDYRGPAARRLGAVIAGVGFGLYIDELGKFITTDNNYFFKPALAIIYMLFVALFLGLRLLRDQTAATEESAPAWHSRISRKPWVLTLVNVLLIFQAIMLVISLAGLALGAAVDFPFTISFDYPADSRVSLMELIGSLVSGGFLIAGAAQFLRSRRRAYQSFMVAVLINILFVQVLDFYIRQGLGILGFVVNIIIYLVLRQALEKSA